MSDTEIEPTELQDEQWSSTLSRGRERFLAHVVEHGLAIGQRTPKDFLRHFPPMAIMEALKDQPRLRADILAFTTGTKQRIAMKKGWESCGEDVEIALSEGATDEESVLDMFEADDRVRYLSAHKLWAYIIEGEFWKISANRKTEQARARTHIAYMLERALEDKLVTQQQIVEALTLEEIALRLPKQVLCEVLAKALANGRGATPFTETDLLEVVSASVMVEHIPLPLLWDSVIVPLAQKHAYLEVTAAEVPANDVAPTSGPDSASISEKSGVSTPLPARSSGVGGSRDAASSRWVAVSSASVANPSLSGFKVPTPTVSTGNAAEASPVAWSAEVNEEDLLDDEESEQVVNS